MAPSDWFNKRPGWPIAKQERSGRRVKLEDVGKKGEVMGRHKEMQRETR